MDSYLKYLVEWAETHKEPEFAGMSPASYDEWHENEYQEGLDKEFDLPDPSIDVSEMNLYGYMWDGMLPLQQVRALELWDADHTIHLIYPDNTEAIVFEREEILQHDGLYGIECQEWEARLDFEALADSARNSEGSREAELLYNSGNRFGIYQIPSGIDEARNFRFASMRELEAHGLSVDRANYELVYTAPFTDGMAYFQNANSIVNEIYENFNSDYPADYKGRSVSVSDVIVLKHEGSISSHFVDSAGFVELPAFLGEETPSAITIDTSVQDKEADNPVGSSQVGISSKDERPAVPYAKKSLAERLAEGRQKSEQQEQNGGNKAKNREHGE